MGGLFSPPTPPAPPPPVTTGLDAQQAAIDKQEADKRRQIASQRQARASGGRQLLLSAERENPQLGINDTLGPA
jgi:hypothetical protein